MDSGIKRRYVSDKTIARGWTKAVYICGEMLRYTKEKRESFVTNGNKKRLGIFNLMLISKLPNQAIRFND